MTRRAAVFAAWTLLLTVVATSALAGRACYLGRPFDSDAAMFVYMGRLVADGGRVGRDVVDNKFPTVGLMMSGPWRVLGTWWAGYVVLGAALSAVAAAAVGEAAARGGGQRGPAVLFAVVLLNITPVVFGGFQLETPIACFACLAAVGAVRAVDEGSAGAAFVAGLAAGCGALLKPTGIGVIGAMGLGVVVRWAGGHATAVRSPVRGAMANADCGSALRAQLLGWITGPPVFDAIGDRDLGSAVLLRVGVSATVGLAVPLSAAAAYLSVAGLWGDLPGTAARLAAYAHGSVVDAVSVVKLATAAAVVGFPLVVGRVTGRLPRSPACTCGAPAGDRVANPRGVVAFAWAWLAIEVAGVVAQRRLYAYHFLPVVPPAALLFGLIRRPTRPWPLLAALGPVAVLGLACAARVTPADGRLAVGRYLSARAAPGDRVWADDYPRLLLETGLRPGSRQALTFLFANDDATAGADSAQIVADLAARRPAFVVLPADLTGWLRRQTGGIVELSANPGRAAAYTAGWRRIERYTLGHYRREATVGDAAVYRRADPIATADVR